MSTAVCFSCWQRVSWTNDQTFQIFYRKKLDKRIYLIKNSTNTNQHRRVRFAVEMDVIVCDFRSRSIYEQTRKVPNSYEWYYCFDIGLRAKCLTIVNIRFTGLNTCLLIFVIKHSLRRWLYYSNTSLWWTCAEVVWNICISGDQYTLVSDILHTMLSMNIFYFIISRQLYFRILLSLMSAIYYIILSYTSIYHVNNWCTIFNPFHFELHDFGIASLPFVDIYAFTDVLQMKQIHITKDKSIYVYPSMTHVHRYMYCKVLRQTSYRYILPAVQLIYKS